MIEIISLDHSGKGIARLDNKVVFVENALPGEIVNIKITKEKKRYIEASVKKYIKKSDDRVNSPCQYYDICGGCDIMHLSYSDQLLFKQEKIKNITNRYLNCKTTINEIVKCKNTFNYRNKTTFQVKGCIGLYKKNTYDIIDIDNCLISDNTINNAIKYLKKLELKDLYKITCRVGMNELMIILETNNKNLNIDCIKSIADSIYLKVDNEYTLIYGKKDICEKIGNYEYLISPDSFFQVNKNTCLNLYNKIKEYVGINKNILDLYCGIGSIGIFVSENNKVIGVEINKFAIENAIENKKINNLNNIDFICGDSGKKISMLNFNPDIIIVDPPRNGLNIETINNIIKFKSNKILYVSCDPMTMVRDLNILNKNYEIIEITPFDMFPNTMHVECLALLQIKNKS